MSPASRPMSTLSISPTRTFMLFTPIAGMKLPLGVGLGLVRRVRELLIDRLRDLGGLRRVRDLGDEPADLPLEQRPLVRVLPVKEHRLVIDRGTGRAVDGADREVEVPLAVD